MHKLSTVIIVRWLPGAWQGTGGGAYCKSVGGHKKSRAPLGSGGKSVVMVSIAYIAMVISVIKILLGGSKILSTLGGHGEDRLYDLYRVIYL